MLEHLRLICEVGLLHLLHQTRQVAHAQQARHERTHIERLEFVNVLAGTDENNRTLSGGDGRQRTTTLGILAVELGQNHRADRHGLAEGAGLILRGLTNRRVHDEHNVVGRDNFGDRLHLLKQSSLLAMATRGIDNDDLKVLRLEALHTFLGHANRVTLRITAQQRKANQTLFKGANEMQK
jgi:hypothetical protein